LDLADHFTARGAWTEHLPDKALASQAQAERAIPAIGALVIAGQEVDGDELAEFLTQLSQGGLAQGLKGTASQGRQGGPETRKVRSIHVGRYVYRPIDTRANLFFMNNQLDQCKLSYESLKARLARVGWISEGYAQDRGPGAGGPCYQWTRKVKGKTVSVALSKEQYEWLRNAIANWREMQQTIKEMQRLSRLVLFETMPHPPRRKKLGKKVLGLI
jgi:hypothetical protein